MPFRMELVKGETLKNGTMYSYFCAGTMICAGSEFPVMFRANQYLNDIVEIVLSVVCHEDNLLITLPCLQIFATAQGGNVWAKIGEARDLPKMNRILLLFLEHLPTLNTCVKRAEDMLDQLESSLANRVSIAAWAKQND